MSLPTPESQSKFERVLVVPPTMYMPDDVAGFYAQSQDEQLDQIEVFHAAYRPSVDELFETTPGLGWVAVGMPTGEIVAKGSDLETAPDKIKETEVLAQQAITRCVPFVFARPTMGRFFLND
jgi:hypothetical protein